MAEAVKAFERGEKVMLCEYRKSVAETINWRDKGTQKPMTAPVLRHTVETATESLTVTERVPDDFNVVAFKAPMAKGAKCLVWLSELKQERGNVSARGTLSEVLA